MIKKNPLIVSLVLFFLNGSPVSVIFKDIKYDRVNKYVSLTFPYKD